MPTYPALITSVPGVDPLNGLMGPFQISGDLYVRLIGSGSQSQIYKSTDGGFTWAQTGPDGPLPPGTITSGTTNYALAVGTKIYNFMGQGSPGGFMEIDVFDTASSTWEPSVITTLDGNIATSALSNNEFLGAVYRETDQNIVVVGIPASIGQTCYFLYDTNTSTAGSWINCGPGTSTAGLIHTSIVRGENRCHMFFVDGTTHGSHVGTLYQQTLEDNGTLETIQIVDTYTGTSVNAPSGQNPAVACSNAVFTSVAVMWQPFSSAQYVYKAVSAASPTWSAAQQIGSAPTGMGLTYGSDGNLYLTYSDGTNAGYYEDTGSGFGGSVVLGTFDADFIQAWPVTLLGTVAMLLDGSLYFWAFGPSSPPTPPAPKAILNAGQGGGGGIFPITLPEPSIRCGRLPTFRQICKTVAPRGFPMLSTKMLLYKRGDSHGCRRP